MLCVADINVGDVRNAQINVTIKDLHNHSDVRVAKLDTLCFGIETCLASLKINEKEIAAFIIFFINTNRYQNSNFSLRIVFNHQMSRYVLRTTILLCFNQIKTATTSSK